MLVYHASMNVISQPDVLHSRENLDFGRGFYTTTLKGQAASYAKKFRLRGKPGIISVFEYTPSQEMQVKNFHNYDGEWLDFVSKCRSGEIIWSKYDVVIGGIANDRVFNTLDLYFSGQMSKKEALKRLSYARPNNQICFISQRAIDKCLQYLRFETVI